MFASRKGAHEPVRPETTSLPAPDPTLRDEVDQDPLVEQMTERLRATLGNLVATDEWGRPVAWRNVVRAALGPTLAELRDAQTAVALADAVIQLPQEAAEPGPRIDLNHATAYLGWPR